MKTDAQKLAELRVKHRKLRTLAKAMLQHLDYISWGRDKWERECGEKLRKRIEKEGI